MKERLKIAVFASGSGTDLQSIIDAVHSGAIDIDVKLVLSNNEKAFALERARKAGIPALVHSSRDFSNKGDFRNRFLEILREYEVNFIVLAGYLKKVPLNIIKTYQNRIINIHPALLPKYGGKGFYGIEVHKAVLQAGETETGVTIHYVDDKYDNGLIIYQKKVPILKDDTPEKLAARVLKTEHTVLPMVIGMIAEGKIAQK